jgi:hypothetical protein
MEEEKRRKEKKSPWRRRVSLSWIHLADCGVG